MWCWLARTISGSVQAERIIRGVAIGSMSMKGLAIWEGGLIGL